MTNYFATEREARAWARSIPFACGDFHIRRVMGGFYAGMWECRFDSTDVPYGC